MKFSILITTKNRVSELEVTLNKIQKLISRNDLECIICDDGSSDNTSEFIKENYPQIQLVSNTISKGLIYSRNRLLSLVNSEFAISLDDDAHFITQHPLESIQEYFEKHPQCGLIALRIFWGLNEPSQIISNEQSTRVKGFVGCGHVWRMKTWNEIPNYPEWFIFYGEEEFASFQMFKKKWEVHYLPDVLVHHRVDVKSRRLDADYSIRLRRSLRAGWYLFILFLPISKIPKKMVYSIWMQFRLKIFKGDLKALKAIILALFDLIYNFPKIVKNRNTLTKQEYQEFLDIEETKIYWKP
jgi:glycosyltransferase involved in cell wall biosynthesis